MEEFRESIKELKDQLGDFVKDYYTELVSIWKKITEIEVRQKFFMVIYGLVVSASTSIVTALIVHYLKK